ncbi:hypothetical protein NPS01_28480 [Nocardioides psychrotolerans]|nr:hypothetical protein NPS01_28480 [Nocardioides psychrotolerans]
MLGHLSQDNLASFDIKEEMGVRGPPRRFSSSRTPMLSMATEVLSASASRGSRSAGVATRSQAQ